MQLFVAINNLKLRYIQIINIFVFLIYTVYSTFSYVQTKKIRTDFFGITLFHYYVCSDGRGT
jgi:hypothetical protein